MLLRDLWGGVYDTWVEFTEQNMRVSQSHRHTTRAADCFIYMIKIGADSRHLLAFLSKNAEEEYVPPKTGWGQGGYWHKTASCGIYCNESTALSHGWAELWGFLKQKSKMMFGILIRIFRVSRSATRCSCGTNSKRSNDQETHCISCIIVVIYAVFCSQTHKRMWVTSVQYIRV